MKHWPNDQLFPDKEFYLARGVNLPARDRPIGAEIKTSMGTAKVIGFREFPLCQYDCVLIDGLHERMKITVDYEKADWGL